MLCQTLFLDTRAILHFDWLLPGNPLTDNKILNWSKLKRNADNNLRCILNQKQEGHDGPVSLHWLIREIHSYQTLHYLGIGLKHKTPYKD